MPEIQPDMNPLLTDLLPFTDRYGLIHTKRVNENKDASTGNGLIYTSLAYGLSYLLYPLNFRRVELQKAAWKVIVQCQVKSGLYRRSPDDDSGEGPDDYLGLGFLSGVCGMEYVAQDILSYGKYGQGAGPWPFKYVYNNLVPGWFRIQAWFGRFPALITHLKLGAGYYPSPWERLGWALSLVWDSYQPKQNQDAYIQSWMKIQVARPIYKYRTSFVMEWAIDSWWHRFHKTWPGGISQVYEAYLGTANHPFVHYLQDLDYRENA